MACVNPFLRWPALAAAVLLAACVSVPPTAVSISRTSQEARACAEWLAELDQAVDAAGVRDAGAYRIPGHPYLRADRFTASFRSVAGQEGAAFDTWVARLRDLDLAARDAELRNLPADRLKPLAADASAGFQKAAQCGLTLAREDLASAEGRQRLAGAAIVPDDYAEWVRSSGLYAVASGPFAAGVDGWHREAHEMFRKAASGEAYVKDIRRVDPAGPEVSAAQVREAMARARRDALGIPRFTAQDLGLLFRAYAPRYEIETTGQHDRFGALAWKGGLAPEIDDTRPVAYRRLAYTRFQGRVLPQLVYTIWFPDRPGDHFLDILAGKIDGLVMRVTLAEDGTPLVWDTMHPCGCYHMFFRTAALKDRPAPDPKEEWAFMPSTLPAMGPGERVAVKTATRTHYLVGVTPAAKAPAATETYAFAGEDDLRALPLPGGGTRSLYGPDALVRGTERPERMFFWPMGIASPGTMRQWGRHPTAFLGKRHFDEADLLEKRFAPAQP